MHWCRFQLICKPGAAAAPAFRSLIRAKLAVCENLRILQHRQFTSLAARGKTGTGWFYGFKLHLIVSNRGELLAWQVTPGNIDDRRPVPKLTKRLCGKLFGDLGYLSEPLKILLKQQNLELITKVKKNIKNKFLNLSDKLLLRKRAIIKTVFDQLKNISNIEHTRHRSMWNFLVNLASGLIAYSWREKKPSLNYNTNALVYC